MWCQGPTHAQYERAHVEIGALAADACFDAIFEYKPGLALEAAPCELVFYACVFPFRTVPTNESTRGYAFSAANADFPLVGSIKSKNAFY